MRIIGGEFRGRRIKQPDLDTVRPTKDRVREAVFNIISGEVRGASVLDIFAGSGAYGLEALSRGADRVLFIEKATECCDVIRKNMGLLGSSEKCKIITEDAFRGLKALCKDNKMFDIVFSDPPFGMGMAKKTLIMISQYDILKPAGLLVVEHSASEKIPETEGNVSICKQKTYGDILISIFQKND